MAHSEDMDPNDHDDQHLRRVQPNIPSDAFTSPTQLITLNQQGSLGDDVPTHYEVH